MERQANETRLLKSDVKTQSNFLTKKSEDTMKM